MRPYPNFYNSFKSCKTFTRLYVKCEIFAPRYLILLAPKVTWFIIGTSRLTLYWFRTALAVSLRSKISYIKAGFTLFSVLKISIQRLLSPSQNCTTQPRVMWSHYIFKSKLLISKIFLNLNYLKFGLRTIASIPSLLVHFIYGTVFFIW